MSAEGDVTSGRIVYTTKEILDQINEKLSRSAQLSEQIEKRVTTLETRVDSHDKILTDQIPELKKVVEDMNVQKQVEAALDSRKVRGTSRTNQMLTAAVGLLILIVGLIDYLQRAGHHP